MQPKHDIILVCSALNQYFAEELGKTLNNAGTKVVLALDDANSSKVNDARLMLLVASSPTLRAATTQSAIESARQAGIPIIAGRIDSNPKSRPESLDDAIWVDDKRDQSDENLVAIVAAVQTKLVELATVVQQPASLAYEEKYDIFISHSSTDKAQADLLWRALDKRGYKCWIAPECIRKTEDWPTAIERGVENSTILALLFNRNSDASDEVRTELAFAKKFAKPIASIRLETMPERYRLEYFIWDKQWISADGASFPSRVEYVAQELETVLKGGGAVTARVLIKRGVRPPDTPASKAANENLSAALSSTIVRAERVGN